MSADFAAHMKPTQLSPTSTAVKDSAPIGTPLDAIDRFLAFASTNPEHPALVIRGESVSYGRLAERVRAFAAQFALRGEARVLIALPQLRDAYSAILATGLAGGFYTPLNLSSPEEKQRKITRLLRPSVICAEKHLGERLRAEAPEAFVLDPCTLDEAEQLSGRGRRHRLAYVIFTSGSTGSPKGVTISRTALDSYVSWLERVGIGPEDRVSQHPNLAFDLSVVDVYGALCFGATLYPLVDEGDRLLPARMIARNKITVWNSVPSVMSLIMQAQQATTGNLGSVRLFNFCGEPLLQDHLNAIYSACPSTTVQNTYGPTEATVSVTSILLRVDNFREALDGSSVSLGDPIPGMTLRLVGGNHPDEGEIVISGPQLAEGYWGDPRKTAHAFQEIPGEGVRGYFTGDWAERRNGLLFFKERLDFQVKLRGYRLELEEVAGAIRACGWPVVCVWKRGETLAAAVETTTGMTLDEARLRSQLKLYVEPYAVPDVIIELKRMPRNENDKLDCRAAAILVDDLLAQG